MEQQVPEREPEVDEPSHGEVQKSTPPDWIPVGRGEERRDLEAVVKRLEASWEGRWTYRIDELAQYGRDRYQLLVRHT